jgi:cell division protein FtsQ
MARPPAEIVRSERLVSRRREVRRHNMRRRRRISLGVLATMVLAGGGVVLVRSSLFALDGIEVTGTKALSRADVVQASGLHPGQSLFSLHADQVRARIEALPRVLRATVHRVRTSWVRIDVVERTPAFVLETYEGRWYLDQTSTILDATSVAVASLPTIRLDGWLEADPGDQVRAIALTDAVRLWGMLPSSLRGGPAILTAAGPAGLTLVRPDFSIRFGSADRLDEKLQSVRLVLASIRKMGGRMVSLDVRSPTRPAAQMA